MPGLDDILAQVGEVDEPHDHASDNVRDRLQSARYQVERLIGQVAIAGRYHLPPRTFSSDYVLIGDVLGDGCNGMVRLAKSAHREHVSAAVKNFKLVDLSVDRTRMLAGEVMTYMLVDHPNIVRLMDVYESSTHLVMVMECMEGGELSERIPTNGVMPENTAKNVMMQILLALNHIHSKGIVHRDIKPENVMFEGKGSDNLKMLDFGFGKYMGTPEDCLRSEERAKTRCGTENYMAPEIMGQNGYTSKCDLWSVGVIAYNLLTGSAPVLAGESLPGMEKVSAVGKSFVAALLKQDPERRASAKQAMKHPWLKTSTGHRSLPKEISASIVDCLTHYSKMPKLQQTCLLMVAWCSTHDERAKVQEYFNFLDRSLQGSVCLEDLRSLFSETERHRNEKHKTGGEIERVSEVFSQIDTNKDNAISYSDFVAAMATKYIGLKDDLLKAAFEKFDGDRATGGTLHSKKSVILDNRLSENLAADLQESEDRKSVV